jgi:membrane fusion protein (multidrug efflux system)
MRTPVYAVAAVLALTACNKKGEDSAAKPPPAPPVKVAFVTAAEAETPNVLVLTGTIAAAQRSEVTADTQGKVIAVMIERGQRVAMGQPVVRLDVRNAAYSGREAQANLEAARAQKQLADEECKRTKSLLDKGAITRSEFDRQNTQCTSAQQQVQAAQARTEMMMKAVTDGVVSAPFKGIVADKSVSPGEWVQPGRALFTLVDDDPLKVELSVPEAAVSAVQLDQKVELTAVAHPEKTYTAMVKRIGGEIGRTRSLIVEAIVDKPPTAAGSAAPLTPNPELVPGMFVEARLVIGKVSRPVLPADAVARRGKTYHAFVDHKGELEERLVQLGPSPGEGQVSIEQGIAKGDKVVAKVTPQIVDGLKVVE